MSLTLYASQADVENIWSQYGVQVRLSDTDAGDVTVGGSLQTQYITDCLTHATVDINFLLQERYSVAVMAASTWIKGACAALAAYYVGMRRGNEVPQTIDAERNGVLEDLRAIKEGRAQLPADDGIATPLNDDRPAVTNPTIDIRWPRSKIRRIAATSTGGDPPASVRDSQSADYWEQ